MRNYTAMIAIAFVPILSPTLKTGPRFKILNTHPRPFRARALEDANTKWVKKFSG